MRINKEFCKKFQSLNLSEIELNVDYTWQNGRLSSISTFNFQKVTNPHKTFGSYFCIGELIYSPPPHNLSVNRLIQIDSTTGNLWLGEDDGKILDFEFLNSSILLFLDCFETLNSFLLEEAKPDLGLQICSIDPTIEEHEEAYWFEVIDFLSGSEFI